MVKVKNFRRFKIQSLRNQKSILPYFLLFTFTFLLSASVSAQTDEPKDAEPPPLKILSKEEKTQLEAVNELKLRTELSLKLMDARLKKAEELSANESYSEMFTELGGFHALVDNTLNFLNRNDNGSRKVLNNFKKIEINLRTFLSRLEVVRRALPLKFEYYVRGLVKVVRDARSRAIEPLFSDTVVPNENPNVPNQKKDN